VLYGVLGCFRLALGSLSLGPPSAVRPQRSVSVARVSEASDDPASCMELASLRGVIRFGCSVETGKQVQGGTEILIALGLGQLTIVVERGVSLYLGIKCILTV
jgi:hypothetical protein